MSDRKSGWAAATIICTVMLILAMNGRAGAQVDVEFMKGVNLEKVRLIAVQHDGRFKTLDTLAREMMSRLSGRSPLKVQDEATGKSLDQDPLFTFLDIVFKPGSYHDVRLIYIKKLPIRQQLAIAAEGEVDSKVIDAILKDGRVSLSFLLLPKVRGKLEELNRDVIRGSKDVDALVGAASWTRSGALASLMRVIPAPDTSSIQDRWYEITLLDGGIPEDDMHAGMARGRSIPGMDGAAQDALNARWKAAAQAWRKGDAAAATEALNGLADELRGINAAVYPPASKMALEHWYYKNHKMTWGWWFYMLAVIPLLMGIVYQWPKSWWTGIVLFVVAFGFHTAATGIRWYLAGRIPNSNMFEAVTAAAWFGAAAAIFLELAPRFFRKGAAWAVSWAALAGGYAVWAITLAVTGVHYDRWQEWGPVATGGMIVGAVGTMAVISLTVGRRIGVGQGLMVLGAAAAGMVSMMCGRYIEELDTDISNRMPVLNDLWLYIHTNMIIASYALIGMAYVTAGIYLVGRMLTRPTATMWMSMLIPAVVMPLPALLEGITLAMVRPGWIPFLLVIGFALLGYVVKWIGGRALAGRSYAVWEGGMPVLGASMVPAGAGVGWAVDGVALSGGTAPAERGRKRGVGLARVLDGTTMILLELSFITLWAGIVMGAIWADHSWGRPWGWDPKEVFALNTWIIFLILVHVRIKVVDKELWTAILAVIGCGVMLFNWVVVNFFITGLHSYA